MVMGSGELTGAGRLAFALPGVCCASNGRLVSTTQRMTERRVLTGLRGILTGMEMTKHLFSQDAMHEDSIPCTETCHGNPDS